MILDNNNVITFRLQLAALHFNKNANKPQRKLKEGVNAGAEQWLVFCPKYKKEVQLQRKLKRACTYGNTVKTRV